MFQPWYSYKISSYKKMKNEFSVKNPHMSNIYSPLVQVVKSKTQVVRVVKRRLAPLEKASSRQLCSHSIFKCRLIIRCYLGSLTVSGQRVVKYSIRQVARVSISRFRYVIERP